MQETPNNCFESKIHSTTLCQEKAGKHECRNIIYIGTLLLYFGTHAYLFLSDKLSCYLFSSPLDQGTMGHSLRYSRAIYLFEVEIYLVLYVVVIFRHSCLPVFAWRRVVLHIFDPKQLLRVSCMVLLFKVLFNQYSFNYKVYKIKLKHKWSTDNKIFFYCKEG